MLLNARDLAYRVVLIGDAAVGKTSIANRFVDDSFNPDELSTVYASHQECREFVDGSPVAVQLWDTAGQERFRSVAPIYYRNAHAAIVVFDVTNPETSHHVADWISVFLEVADSDTVIAVAGNKIDSPDRNSAVITEGRELAEAQGYLYVETSAKTGAGISTLFSGLLRGVIDAERQTTTRESDETPTPEPPESTCSC
jgi:small GTP-binding protein